MLRGLREGDERYRREYWLEGDDGWRYRTGDGATVDEDGYVTILGRVDDVINVRTHRFNTAELESAIVGPTASPRPRSSATTTGRSSRT